VSSRNLVVGSHGFRFHLRGREDRRLVVLPTGPLLIQSEASRLKQCDNWCFTFKSPAGDAFVQYFDLLTNDKECAESCGIGRCKSPEYTVQHDASTMRSFLLKASRTSSIQPRTPYSNYQAQSICTLRCRLTILVFKCRNIASWKIRIQSCHNILHSYSKLKEWL
jgi:hypothetical protein